MKKKTKKPNKDIKQLINSCTQVEQHLMLRLHNDRVDFGFIDRLIIFSGPLIPTAVFIQAYGVWSTGSADGFSLFTWSLLLFASITMAGYATYHRTKPLMITYVPLVFANALVVSGILLL